jgi:hypothetical protein
MKRILILILLAFLFLPIEAQIIRANPFYVTPVAGELYGIDELWDGHTKAWFEYDTAVSVTSGLVTQWNDISGNGNHLLPYASDGSAGQEANRPAWHTTNGITFDGTDDVLKVTITGWTTFGSVYAVIKQVAWASNDVMFAYSGTGSVRVGQKGTTPNLLLLHASGDGAAGSTLTVGDWGIIRLRVYAVVNDNAVMVINDGSELANTTDMDGFTSGGVILGAVHAAAPALQRYGNVAIKEIIYRDIVDSSGDETAIYNYLKTKYSL